MHERRVRWRGGRKTYVCDPRSGLQLEGRDKGRARTTNGMEKTKRNQSVPFHPLILPSHTFLLCIERSASSNAGFLTTSLINHVEYLHDTQKYYCISTRYIVQNHFIHCEWQLGAGSLILGWRNTIEYHVPGRVSTLDIGQALYKRTHAF